MLFIIHHLISGQIRSKTDEMNNIVRVLEHATGREIRAIFNNVTTLTNQIMIEPDIQRILLSRMQQENPGSFGNASIDEKYVEQDTIRAILSKYRLVWNDIISIAIVDTQGTVYLSTSENYMISPKDLEQSKLMQEVASPSQSGLAWSVHDILTKRENMITIARKIYGVNRPQSVIGYVLVNMSLNAVRDSFETYNYYDQMIFGMLNNSQGKWMIYDKKKIVGGDGQLLPEPLNGSSGFIHHVELNGRSWRIIWEKMDQKNYLFVGLDEDYIRKETAQIRNNLYLGYAFFLLLAVFISLRGTKTLSQRLGQILKGIRKFGQEQWGTRIELKGNDEIRIIGDQFNVMASHIEGLLHDLKEQQRLKRLFELRVLEYQINPHFLYNTLDSIYWLALENGQTKISDMVSGLSKLFRIILNKGKETITLSEELEMINIYFHIQKIRFEDRFDYSIHLEPDIADYPIAKLVLQPLVENAIVHGIRRLRYRGLIQVACRIEGDEVVLEIADNGVGMSKELVRRQLDLLASDVLEEGIISSTGYGMKNVDSRLKLLYGNDYRMVISSSTTPPTGTVIQIRIRRDAMIKMKESLS